jgi:high frequency lysogenization protein
MGLIPLAENRRLFPTRQFMTYSEQDKLIALAGIFQSALCVRQIARQGSVDTDTMEPCIYGLFQTDPDSVREVFGSPGSLTPGVNELVGQLTGKQPPELELTSEYSRDARIWSRA